MKMAQGLIGDFQEAMTFEIAAQFYLLCSFIEADYY
jgi:hypothetical protein